MGRDSFLLYLDVAALVWGAIWGSFLNVVIYRLPAGKSLVKPPSHCPHCKTRLAFYDNIPVFGWLILRGRCRYCKTRIPVRYPLVEALVALLSLGVWLLVSWGRLHGIEGPLLPVAMAFVLYFYFVAILVAIAFIDLDHTIIPHELTGLAAVLGAIALFALPRQPELAGLWPAVQPLDGLYGLLLGGGAVAIVIKGYALIRGFEGMGWGDFTLMGVVGIWLGWQGVVFVFFLGSLQGLAAVAGVAIWQKLTGRSGDFLIENPDEIVDPAEVTATGVSADSDGPAGGNTEDPTTRDEVVADTDDVSDDLPADDAGVVSTSDEGDGDGRPLTQMAVPFGPFLALAAIEYLLFGELITSWVLGP